MYDYKKRADDCLYDDIDSKYIRKYLEDHYEIYDEAKLEVRLKEEVKYLTTFASLTAKLNIPSRELIKNLYFIFPEIFNHYTVKKMRMFIVDDM